MDLKLLFDEFAASMVRAPRLTIEERLTDWTHAVKKRFIKLGARRGYATFANDDRRKSASYLWDVTWSVEDNPQRGQPPTGAGVPELTFPVVPYRKLVLALEVMWGRQGQRPQTQVFRQNLEEVFRDFYKLLDANGPVKVMVYTSWSYPHQSGVDGLFLQGFQQILKDFEAHRPGDQYLFVEFDDAEGKLRGFTTSVPRRGPRPFHMQALGEVDYPRRWRPAP